MPGNVPERHVSDGILSVGLLCAKKVVNLAVLTKIEDRNESVVNDDVSEKERSEWYDLRFY